MISVVFCLAKWGQCMLRGVLFIICFIPATTLTAKAAIPTTSYVDGAVATRVDTSSDANQTMAGTYNVSGTMTVPTPPLPAVE